MSERILGAKLPSVLALAYLGDACYSLYVRDMLVRGGLSKTKELNLSSLEFVTCQRQALMYEKIKPHLSEEEALLARRAFNSTHLNPPKKAKIKDYRSATAFEAVIGMLYYVKDEKRLGELLSVAHREEDENDTEN